jgi:hypothetical protein
VRLRLALLRLAQLRLALQLQEPKESHRPSRHIR